jgi:hypothetical protein
MAKSPPGHFAANDEVLLATFSQVAAISSKARDKCKAEGSARRL